MVLRKVTPGFQAMWMPWRPADGAFLRLEVMAELPGSSSTPKLTASLLPTHKGRGPGGPL